jgi:hypothetical protein
MHSATNGISRTGVQDVREFHTLDLITTTNSNRPAKASQAAKPESTCDACAGYAVAAQQARSLTSDSEIGKDGRLG